MPPAVLICAGWTIDVRRREVYRARVARRAIVRLNPPVGGWTLASLLREARSEAQGGSALVGIDVPLGVPSSLADAFGPAAGAHFLDLLRHAGSIPGFFDTCPEPARWSPRRPFFGVEAGEEGLRRWTRQLESHGVSAYRAIDLATAGKSPLVVSGVPGAVGAAARDVWRTLVADVEAAAARVWPFEGSLADLTAAPGTVLGEIHPRAAYAIALTPGAVLQRPRLAIAKTDKDARAVAVGLHERAEWVRQYGVVLGGLDAARHSDDAFDALLSAAALLRCVLEGTPLEPGRTHPMEGGSLGTDSVNLELRERTFRRPPRGEIAPSPPAVDAPPEQHPCPIPGCARVFTSSRSGWDAHVASARLHPKWHPEVAHGTQRKALFRREFPRFFGEQHGERELLSNLGTRRQRLQDLLARCSDHWRYEDPVYRFYHQSFKVYSLQETTQAIIAELRGLVPGRPLHHSFARIAADGTGRTFTPADNQHWLETTRPIVEAFFHARFFLEMAVRYAHIDAPPSPLPSGYAALLRLFDLR